MVELVFLFLGAVVVACDIARRVRENRRLDAQIAKMRHPYRVADVDLGSPSPRGDEACGHIAVPAGSMGSLYYRRDHCPVCSTLPPVSKEVA